MSRLAAAVAAVGFIVGCEPAPADIVDTVDNTAPVTRVVGAQLARIGEPARYNATASDDVDGVIVAFSASFGDGAGLVSGDEDGLFEHVFAAPGRFTVRIEAEDDLGALAAVALETVVVDGEVEACGCDAPCLDAGLCSAADGCVVVATSADEVAPVVDDVVRCE
jgi:hypothetical protein